MTPDDPTPLPLPRQSSVGPAGKSALSWRVVFIDLIALLLAFFVLLYSMSELKLDAWLTVTESLSDRLNPSHDWSEPLLTQTQNAKRAWQDAGVDLDYLQALIERRLQGDPLFSNAELRRRGDYLSLTLPANTLFASGQAVLSGPGRETVTALSAVLSVVENRVDVIGHSDPRPLSASNPFRSNWELSLSRALQVALLLKAGGYGEPIASYGAADSDYFSVPEEPRETRDSRARRVEIRIARDASTASWADVVPSVAE